MAGRGPAPKSNAVRRNVVDTAHLEQDYEVPGRLKKLAKRASYSAATQMWWDTWANSEQSEYFAETDWLRLQMLAPLVESYYRKPGHFVMSEIRQSESLLGATIADRMRLKVAALKDKQTKQVEAPPTIEADLALFAELSEE
ncbi:hypothetical protein [Actinomadura oligospora]|uniref:phage terminase small subunit n=1 Tax=Actinomadura oligospora TaxID=111804 RepID=UPI0012FC1CAE|nr:hypothetical protein [Actinomadura oligospora]